MMRECLRLIAIPLFAVSGAAVAADGVPAGDAQSTTLNEVIVTGTLVQGLKALNATPISNIRLSYQPMTHLKLSAGADNVFDTFPNQENPALIRTYFQANDGAGAYIHPSFSPFGLNGGYYYGRITVSF
jgi:hypothetical protein